MTPHPPVVGRLSAGEMVNDITGATIEVGQRMIFIATVSNWGHQKRVPVEVVRIGAKRVTVETRYNDDRPERRISVKPENLRHV